jgi:AcrR family transcriptional regulator
MAQVKKNSVRQAILDVAYDMFSERGYHSTTLQDICERAGIGVSSLYSYFPSKLHLLYALAEPWQKDAFERLQAKVKALETPRERLRCILLGVWRDIPQENIGLANSLMEALSSADPAQKKPSTLLRVVEHRLASMLQSTLPAHLQGKVSFELLANLFLMAYDGFVINRRLNDLRDIEKLVSNLCDILLGSEQLEAAGKSPRLSAKVVHVALPKTKRATLVRT